MTGQEPKCPKCGKPMRHVRTIPKAATLPELRSYECRPCREAVTEPVETR